MHISTDLAEKIPLADSADPALAEIYPKRRSDISARPVGCETVVLDRRSGLIHQLNQTASYIWERCDGRSTVAEIIRQLTEGFDVDAKTAVADVTSIIGQLEKLNLLEGCSGPRPLSDPLP